jgi:hypothetical protein
VIKLKDCRHGYAYELSSRNLLVGVFNKKTKGFMGIREKFGDHFLFEEFHRDTGAPYGTVTPIKKLKKCPLKDLRDRVDSLCKTCGTPVVFVASHSRTATWQACWAHVHNSTCNYIQPDSQRNTKLFKWLKPIEAPFRKAQNAKWKKTIRGPQGKPL